jgi:3-hydroxyacyl-CoA dehydrogenase
MIIRSVAVLGAGVMGSQIAAHFANAGVPSLLLDVTRDAAAQGLKRARGMKPDPFFLPDGWKLVTTASFDDGMPRLPRPTGSSSAWSSSSTPSARCSSAWTGRDGRQRRQLEHVRHPDRVLAEGRSDDFRRHWLGTHFFNPPRYLRLLELIPTPDTDPAVLDGVAAFADLHLGKGVVVAKDSPNFIGNHLALFDVVRALALVAAGTYSIEEIDAITGPPIGRPKSATFRTLDLAGIDILAHVVRNLAERLTRSGGARHVRPAAVRGADARPRMDG